LPIQKELEEKVTSELTRFKTKAAADLWTAYTKITDLKMKMLKSEGQIKSTQTVSLEAPNNVKLGQAIVVKFTTDAKHSTQDWIGLYEQETPSKPGMSQGKWRYVPAGETGSVEFTSLLLPTKAGAYEIRYHVANTYEIVQARAIIVDEAPSSSSSSSSNESKTD
jgi:hypothetical protein